MHADSKTNNNNSIDNNTANLSDQQKVGSKSNPTSLGNNQNNLFPVKKTFASLFKNESTTLPVKAMDSSSKK